MGVSKNNGTPKSSILIGFSIINHPFWGTPIFGNTHIVYCMYTGSVFQTVSIYNTIAAGAWCRTPSFGAEVDVMIF